MFLKTGLVTATLAVLQACLAFGSDVISPQTIDARATSGNHWIEAWTAMPQLTEYYNLPNPPFNASNLVFFNSTIRQTMQMSIGAEQIRIRFSNNFGPVNLPITAVTIARPLNGSAGASAIDTKTLQTVTFSGSESFSVPDGGLVVSDVLNFPIQPLEIITITMYLAEGQASNLITSHPGSRINIFMSEGNFVKAENLTDPSVQSTAHWYFLSAIDAWVPSTMSTFAIVGDSITDGHASDTDENDRWPDLLRQRMLKNPATAGIAIANQAAGGNRILADGLGPAALARIDRDVLAINGVKFAMIFEGVNDIGVAAATEEAQAEIYDQLILAYKQIITRVHAFKIPIFAATITPFGSPANTTIQPYSSPVREATRQKINSFIRTSGLFDGVIDFDAVVRDPSIPSQLAPEFNSGDYLHPNVPGYQAMANSFSLDIFAKFPNGVAGFN